MSLHYLGIAHFPVLHRQFSSPTSRSSPESSPSNQDLTQDNKDVLVERLNDLVSRLSKNDSLEDGTVSVIHSEVDRIETLMRDNRKPSKSPRATSDGFEPKSPKINGEDIFWGPPLTPTRNVRMRLPDTLSTPNSPRSIYYSQAQMTPSRAAEIAKAAEDLASKLATAAAELLIRKEESDHIHDMLITRAERAAKRIIELESRISEMEEDFEANQSDLRFLRIQLQAIEAQCSQYIPRDEDQELTQSIINWRTEWEDIDRRSKARKNKIYLPPTALENITAINQ